MIVKGKLRGKLKSQLSILLHWTPEFANLGPIIRLLVTFCCCDKTNTMIVSNVQKKEFILAYSSRKGVHNGEAVPAARGCSEKLRDPIFSCKNEAGSELKALEVGQGYKFSKPTLSGIHAARQVLSIQRLEPLGALRICHVTQDGAFLLHWGFLIGFLALVDKEAN